MLVGLTVIGLCAWYGLAVPRRITMDGAELHFEYLLRRRDYFFHEIDKVRCYRTAVPRSYVFRFRDGGRAWLPGPVRPRVEFERQILDHGIDIGWTWFGF